MRTLLAMSVVLALLTSCERSADVPSVQGTRELDTATGNDQKAEEERIRALEQRWRQALAAKDTAAITAFYAEDGYYLPQGSDGYVGAEDVGKRWAGEFAGRKFTLEREPKTIEVARSGDMAYEAGSYKVSWDNPKERQKGEGAGNYVTVWKKVEGEWKTAAYIWNRGEEK